MGTKSNPGLFDCYKNAEPDEPMFVLLARDESASRLVSDWACIRQAEINAGRKPVSDQPIVDEALRCATEMARWRSEKNKNRVEHIL